jgi:iron complex outermembrane receptor protein
MYSNVASNSGNRNALLPSSPTLSNGSSDILNTEFRVPQYFSDYYVQKAWFVRVDNINIGYSFGRILKNKIGLRVFATIQNAFLITKYKGVDPEIFNGIDNNLYPRPRIFSLGVNIQI